MSFLPGWDSVSSTETIAHYLHVAAVVVLGLLFVAEGMALVYDFRNHRLIKAAESAREIAQKAKEDAAEARRKTEVEGLEKQLSDADKQLSQLRAYQAQRRLTDEQKTALVKELSPFAGQLVTVVSIIGDEDGQTYAGDFFKVLSAAGWDIEYGRPLQWSFSGKTPIGIGVWINEADAKARRILKSADTFVTALTTLKLIGVPNEIGLRADVPSERIWLVIGVKPRL